MVVRRFVGCALLAAASAAHAAPQRIVSLNLCADELVLRLARPGTVKSVTWLARDAALSNVSELAQAVPANQGSAEEIVPLQPDLVIAGAYTTRMTTALLKRLGIPVLEIGVADSVESALKQIERVASVLGEREAGARLIAEIKQRLAALPTTPDARQPLAAIYQPNGFTIGQGSLVNDLMRRAGFRNLAAEQRVDQYGSLSLETLLRAQPDFLVMNADSDERAPAMAYEILQHPALTRTFDKSRIVNVPSAWWSCPGPRMVDAVERLQRAAQTLPMRDATRR